MATHTHTLPTHMVLSEEISITSHTTQSASVNVSTCVYVCVFLRVCVPIPVCPGLSWCEVGEQIGGQQGGQARVTPRLSCVCTLVSLCMCVFVCVCSLTTTSGAHWQAEVNKIDGVDSY